MSTQISILVPTFNRDKLLNYTLMSYAKQPMIELCEVIVLNEGADEPTKTLCSKYPFIKYIHTGRDGSYWRGPGFAYNIGCKQAIGKVLILTSPEVMNINNAIQEVALPVLADRNIATYPIGKFDSVAEYLNAYEQNKPRLLMLYEMMPDVNKDENGYPLPFFLALDRTIFEEIHGYDEDFIGLSYDDNDFLHRLHLYGIHFHATKGRVIHLWHPRHPSRYTTISLPDGREVTRHKYNEKLFHDRKGIILRNMGKEWGKL